MKWLKENLILFGLTREEGGILSELNDALSLQELSKKLPIPRTTIAYVLKGLLKRGFVFRMIVGKRYKFYALSPDQLHERVEKVVGLGTRKILGTNGLPSVSNAQSIKKIQYFNGLKDVMKAQEDFLRIHCDERIYAIQPNKSWAALHTKAGDEHVMKTNKIIKENRLILEGILEDDAYELFKRANQHKSDFAQLAESFSGRMADYIFAPKGYLTDQIEMWIIKDNVLFIDWIEEVGIKISDKHITNFLKDMFTLVKVSGKKIDHNQAIHRLIEK